MLRHIAPVVGLLFFAPISAEYLYGYDSSTGDVAELLGGLVVFVPLYGAVAVLIRELARRFGRGWPTILLLGLAFGIIQAGLIDHSMFNPAYRDIEYWDELFAPTYLPALGVSPAAAVQFVTGHLVWSFAVPIAVVESIVPERRTEPWLGKVGPGVLAVGYLIAAAVVFQWHLRTEEFLPTAKQFAGAGVVVGTLAVAAFLVGRPSSRAELPERDRVVSPWVAGAMAFLILLRLPDWFLPAWPAFVLNLALLTALAVLVSRWSRAVGWGPVHHVGIAGGALLANVVPAFATEPIGEVSQAAKFVHNAVALLVVIGLLAIAAVRIRRYPVETKSRGA